MTIIEDRINQPITLTPGQHAPASGDMCLLEAVAWIAGEPWSDHPDMCRSGVGGVRSFMERLAQRRGP